MKPITFTCVPHITIECGGARLLTEWCRGAGNVLLVHNAVALAQRVSALIAQSGSAVATYRQRGEPAVADVDGAMAICRRHECRLVVGLGGGSAIDLAKAVAAIAANGGEALDYMEVVGRAKKIEVQPLPWFAVPTTAGTGAEATRNAVILSPEQKFKASIRSEKMLATRILIDPELAVGVPPAVTAASGCDALCQTIESYTSNGANSLTDGLALEAVALARTALPRAFTQGADLQARQDMAIAALLSGITLSNAGLGAVHGLAAPLGGNCKVPHGVVCAALLPLVMEVNTHLLQEQGNALALARYARVCRVLTQTDGTSDSLAIAQGIEWVHVLVRKLGIPRLGEFGVAEAHVPGVAALAQKASSMRYNPVVLSAQTLETILRRAL
jgi:alcohol dehydrogenase class IV